MRTVNHPTLGILCREDGAVYAPDHHNNFRWTFGSKNKGGYLCIGYKGKRYRIHRLIAEAFLPNPDSKPTVDHIDRNRQNNALSNLRWATMREQGLNRTGHHRVLERGGALCADRSAYMREDYQRRKAAGLIYHRCCDGKQRWHLPGNCPVTRNGDYFIESPIYVVYKPKLV